MLLISEEGGEGSREKPLVRGLMVRLKGRARLWHPSPAAARTERGTGDLDNEKELF